MNPGIQAKVATRTLWLIAGAFWALTSCAGPARERGQNTAEMEGLWREMASLSLLNQSAEVMIQGKNRTLVQRKEENLKLVRQLEGLKWEAHRLAAERKARGQEESPFVVIGMEEKNPPLPPSRSAPAVPTLNEKDIHERVMFLKAMGLKSRDDLLREVEYLKKVQSSYRQTLQEREGQIWHYDVQELELTKEMGILSTQIQFLKSDLAKGVKADSVPSGGQVTAPVPRAPIREETIHEPLQSQAEAPRRSAEAAHGSADAAQPKAEPPRFMAPTQASVETKPPQGERVVTPPPVPSAPVVPAPSPAPAKKRLPKIKVLSGDGKIESAKKAADRLERLGYKVHSIDKNPRPGYQVTTVFYVPLYRVQAQNLARQLGTPTALKPLTWASDFDLIVVTGR